MKDFYLRLTFKTTPQKLYEAVATSEGVRHWWTQFVEGDAKLGGKITMRFPKSEFFATMEVVALQPGELVMWRCKDAEHPARLGFKDPRDWVDTYVKFQISKLDSNSAMLEFSHSELGLLECHNICSNNWSYFLNESLRGYLETGEGDPVTE